MKLYTYFYYVAVIVFVVGCLYLASVRDKQMSEYWDHQFAICQKVGYYDVGGGYCVPSEDLQKTNY